MEVHRITEVMLEVEYRAGGEQRKMTESRIMAGGEYWKMAEGKIMAESGGVMDAAFSCAIDWYFKEAKFCKYTNM